jgi:hypothetical protein
MQSQEGESWMFARIAYFRGSAPQIDAATALIRDRLEPSLATQSGFLGAITVVDRAAGEGLASTFWNTVADMGAAEEMGLAARTEAGERAGVQLIDVDRFEILLQDRVAASAAGTFARTTELRGLPDKIDATVAYMRDKGVDLLRPRPGYRGLLVMANRATGRIRISSSWSTAADRDNTAGVPSGIREEVALIAGAGSFTVTRYEVVLTTVSQAAQQAAAIERAV